MRTYQLRYPGAFLDLPDHAISGQVFSLLMVIESAFVDAAVALNLFESRTVCNPPLPRQYEHRLPFINARTFLYALDTIGKVLVVVAEQYNLPPQAKAVCDKFQTLFPTLTPLRDTAQHIEDRARGVGRGGKPITLQPITNMFINAPRGGVLAIDILQNNRYGSTMADGNYGEIEVSDATMEQVKECLQALLDALPWKGPGRDCPS